MTRGTTAFVIFLNVGLAPSVRRSRCQLRYQTARRRTHLRSGFHQTRARWRIVQQSRLWAALAYIRRMLRWRDRADSGRSHPAPTPAPTVAARVVSPGLARAANVSGDHTRTDPAAFLRRGRFV